MPSHGKKAFFGNLVFEVCENVYEPAEDSFLFADNLAVEQGERVLDVGIGSGILGIIAAEKAKEVVAVDVNPYAIRCAKQNAVANKAQHKMVFLQADLFSALSEKARFDLILFNAPYVPSEACETETWLGRAWAGGASGRQVINRFIVDAPKHLEREGRVLLMQSTLAGVAETRCEFAECNMQSRVVAERALPFFETLELIEAVFKN